MLNKYFTLCLGTLFLLQTAITADGIKLPNLPEKKAEPLRSGIDVFHVQYHLYGAYAVYKNRGNYIGVRINQEKRSPNAYYFSFDPVFAVGENDYRTVPHFGLPYTKFHIKQTELWFNCDFKYGYTFQPATSQNFLLSAFAGPGYHYEGYGKAKASWYYGLLGIRATQQYSKHFAIGIDLKTMYSFAVVDISRLTVITRFGRSNFWGLEVGLPMIWQIGTTSRFDFKWKPYFLKLNLNSIESILGSTLELGYTF
jgi:hypothetical protein